MRDLPEVEEAACGLATSAVLVPLGDNPRDFPEVVEAEFVSRSATDPSLERVPHALGPCATRMQCEGLS